MADLAIDADVAFRLLDEAVDHRKSKPGAHRSALGGEERLEHLAQVLRRDARPGIGDREQGILAGRHVAKLPAIGLVERCIGGFNGDTAAAWHCVARVDDQIDDGVLELAHVHECRPQAAAEDGFDRDRLPHRAGQHLR